MRDGRQEDMWRYVAKICYVTAVVQSMEPKKIKIEDFNDWEQIQKELQRNDATPSHDQ